MAETLLVRSPELPNHEKWKKRFDFLDIKLVAETGLSKTGAKILFVVDAPHEDNIKTRVITKGRKGDVFERMLSSRIDEARAEISKQK